MFVDILQGTVLVFVGVVRCDCANPNPFPGSGDVMTGIGVRRRSVSEKIGNAFADGSERVLLSSSCEPPQFLVPS